jgi:hypothetical protein
VANFNIVFHREPGDIRGRVVKFVECGFIATHYKVFTNKYTDPHPPTK